MHEDLKHVEQLTEGLQTVFNEFAAVFNSFIQREQRLEMLHEQAVKKSKELDKRLELDLGAQNS